MNDIQANQLKDMHDFWFKSDNPNRPTRAERVDDMLQKFEQGRFLMRTSYWLIGGLIFLAANFERVQDFVMRR
jgi:hypothetical protein